jgi:16S rRNA (guanine527-N7)-methyltransferase
MTHMTTYEALLEGRVPDVALPRLDLYAQLVERWSARHNLVRVKSRRELVERHIVEALALLPEMGKAGRLVDVGSGAGLPGVPLLCARPGWSGCLLEPREKRWAFLKTVVRELELDAQVVAERFEEWGGEGVDLVTARAVGGHKELLSWARTRLAPGGTVAIWATENEEERLRTLPSWRVLSSPLIGLDRGRLIRFQVCST